MWVLGVGLGLARLACFPANHLTSPTWIFWSLSNTFYSSLVFSSSSISLHVCSKYERILKSFYCDFRVGPAGGCCEYSRCSLQGLLYLKSSAMFPQMGAVVIVFRLSLLCICVYLCMCRWVQIPKEPRGGCWIPGVGVAGGCELPDVGAGTWTPVL